MTIASLQSRRQRFRDALQWEKRHRSALAATRGGDPWQDPIEEPPVDPDNEEDPMLFDLPGGADLVGKRLVAVADGLGEPRRQELERCRQAADSSAAETRELPSHLDPRDLSQTGWGVITPPGMKGDYLEKLRPLLDRRKKQAGKLYREDLVYTGQPAEVFLWDDLNLSPGVVDPEQMPYFILLVGGPERIPFEVQYQLAINHAVGRVAFDESEEEGFEAYRQWAEAVVAAEEEAEREEVDPARRAAILSVDDGGRATALLRSHLVEPIAERLRRYFAERPQQEAWEIDTLTGRAAEKRGFTRALGGPASAPLTLVAAHGLSLHPDNPHQKEFQGALCCQNGESDSAEERYFHAGDLEAAAGGGLEGTIAFLFSCFGAGTPQVDDYPQQTPEGVKLDPLPESRRLADNPFLSALPQAMLKKGALAVVGHVDRGWTLSFAWTLAYRYTDAVRSLDDSLCNLLAGHRLGHALRPLHRRYTAIAAHLTEPLDRHRRKQEVDSRSLGVQWTALHDARNFIVLGDPAVTLAGAAASGGARSAAPIGDAEIVFLPPDLADAVSLAASRESQDFQQWVEGALRRRLDTEAG